jgi:hypothetical protein
MADNRTFALSNVNQVRPWGLEDPAQGEPIFCKAGRDCVSGC